MDNITKLRLSTKRRVEEAIQNKYGKRFTVEFFGSIQYVDSIIDKNDLADHYMFFSYGVSLPKSDLDLVIVVSPDSLSQLVIFRFLKGLN